MFLGLLTSRYAEDDFLKSLPTKLMIGLSTMFISLATMMAAFCASLFLMLQNRSWIVIPVTLLASVPNNTCDCTSPFHDSRKADLVAILQQGSVSELMMSFLPKAKIESMPSLS
ncbi:hypothetical protein AHAS_Ahas09G0213500 [Arachis hypogaea]